MKKPSKNKAKSVGLLDKVTSVFSCAGALKEPKAFKIFWNSESLTGSLDFPEPKADQVDFAIKHAKKSSFGKGEQNVLDESYRKAFEILPENLGLSSYLQQTISQAVTQTISHQLCSLEPVRAELIKLNIYTEGCFFKSHVDSPKKQAFGSLVVFLPCYFEGGELIVQHNKEEKVYYFGGKEKNLQVNWVAFFNDCVHEIREVKKGFRLTLSYNLYYASVSPFVEIFPNEEIVEVLDKLQPKKLYGYYCEHYYGNNALAAITPGTELKVLKGKDAQLWIAGKAVKCKQMRLKVLFKQQARYKNEAEHKMFEGPPERIHEVKQGIVYDDNYSDEISEPDHFANCFKATMLEEDIVWLNICKDQSKYVFAINGYYGNDYSIGESYCQLVIFIEK